MPIKTACPGCNRPYNLADTMAGKMVRCKDCGNTFTVQAAAARTAVAAVPQQNGRTATALAPRMKTAVNGPPLPRRKRPAVRQNPDKKIILIIAGVAAAVLLIGGGVLAFAILRSGKTTESTATAQNTPPASEDEDTPKKKPRKPVSRPAPDTKPATPAPEPTPIPPPSLITKANFEKITGGMSPADLQTFLGTATQPNAPIEAAVRPLVGPDGTTQKWVNGADSISVSYCSNQTTHWSGMINGQPLGPVDDPAYAYKPPAPTPAPSLITKSNFDKIHGGMSLTDLQSLLGTPTEANAPVEAIIRPKVGPDPHGKTQTWVNGADSITVSYCDGKATHWSGLIDGQPLGPKDDAAFAYKQATNPGSTTKVTLANYNTIMINASNYQQLVTFFGQPTSQTPPRVTQQGGGGVIRGRPGVGGGMTSTRFEATWTDGQGGHMQIHFHNNIVENKSQQKLK